MFDRLLGQPVLTRPAAWLTGRRLRVIGLHDVPDADAFEPQAKIIRDHYRPVSLRDVVAWLDGGADLPRDAALVTFDDGERSAVVGAGELLASHGIPATVFVCPAFVDGTALPWWEIVEAAVDDGVVVRVAGRAYRTRAAVTALKSVPDAQRREIVDALPVADSVANAPRVTLGDLRRWRELGHSIGNHTWDHPCLDQCTPVVQIAQIDAGAAWLDRHALWEDKVFAYPNGDWTAEADEHLRGSEHTMAILFDHRLASRHPDRYAVSRLKLGAGVSPARTEAIVSGVHSGLFGVRRSVPRRLLPAPSSVDGDRVGS